MKTENITPQTAEIEILRNTIANLRHVIDEKDKLLRAAPPWLSELLAVLGWKGGTIHQALSEVESLAHQKGVVRIPAVGHPTVEMKVDRFLATIPMLEVPVSYSLLGTVEIPDADGKVVRYENQDIDEAESRGAVGELADECRRLRRLRRWEHKDEP